MRARGAAYMVLISLAAWGWQGGSMSAAVALKGGGELAGIVVPAEPTPAERYAAEELQRCIAIMTDRELSIQGADGVITGRMIRLGGDTGQLLEGRPQDAYIVGLDSVSGNILLAGRIDRGTLYAAYDFLKMQGCGWYMPGEVGEVIPRRTALVVPTGMRIESPDYDVRGFMGAPAIYNLDGQSGPIDVQAYLDWAVRNRMNAFWMAAQDSVDFGAHRGYGHLQRLNHSYRTFLNDDHPEWWVLHNGERTKRHTSGRPNQLCVSNPELREDAARYIVDYFRANPLSAAFPLNAEDDPCYWCECARCRVLDPDEGQGEWLFEDRLDGYPVIGMADRALNFANAVAERVAEVYPDKLIEMYAYATTRDAPVREKVHPNVLIKFTFSPTVPGGKPLLSPELEDNAKIMAQLDGWKAAGTRHFGLYDYGNFFNPDVPLTWYFLTADSLRTFNERWGIRHCLPESDSNFGVSAIIYNLRAEILWDASADYRRIMKRVCDMAYGPAADAMYVYHVHMDDVMLTSDAWQKPDWLILKLWEYDLAAMRRGKELLDTAWQLAGDDERLKRRIAPVRFGHAYMTLVVGQRPGAMENEADRRDVAAAGILATTLCRGYHMPLNSATTILNLQNSYTPPPAGAVVLDLPLQWEFRTDPDDAGRRETWYAGTDTGAWTPILVDRAWTEQGHAYHGAAWYRTEFALPTPAPGDAPPAGLVVYFEAVDGLAEVYLNGRKIGEQVLPVELMWDKPFDIPLPADMDRAAKHTLVVRVEKDRFAAGIWRPVRVVGNP